VEVVLANSGHAKLSSTTNSNSQLGQLVKKDEWTFSNLPVNDEQELQNLYTKMTVLSYNGQEKKMLNNSHICLDQKTY
jgi:hypothetical protein